MISAQQSNKSVNYMARLPFGSTSKTYSCDTNNNYIYIRKNNQGNPLPESCVGLCITLCTQWILNTHIKIVFCTTIFNIKTLQTHTLYGFPKIIYASIWSKLFFLFAGQHFTVSICFLARLPFGSTSKT